MGAGRKTTTIDYDTRGAAQQAMQSFEQRQRNLGEDLGGAIFGCTNDTMQECLDDLVFGLPRPHWCYVQWITKGMPIFLFNYTSRKLHGIFIAESDGEWEIKPDGWCRTKGTKTLYPAQARVKIYKDCEPLSDREYRALLTHSFSDDENRHLLFELKRNEAQVLCRAFDEKTEKLDGRRSSSADHRPMPSATGASSALAHGKQPFRPASPPAFSAWGGRPSQEDRKEPEKPKQEVPKPSDFPDLSGSGRPESFDASQEAEAANGPTAPEKPEIKKSESEKQLEETATLKASPRKQSPAAKALPGKQTAAAKALPLTVGSLRDESSALQLVRQEPDNVAKAKGKDIATAKPATASPRGALKSSQAEDNGHGEPFASSQTNGGHSLGSKKPKAAAGFSLAGASSSRIGSAESSSAAAQAQSSRTQAASQPTAQIQAGGFQAPSEFKATMEAAYAALRNVDPACADAMWRVMSHMKSRVDQTTESCKVFGHLLDAFKVEREALLYVLSQQSHIIELLREETSLLRRDLAFVGGHINITVAPANAALDSFPSLLPGDESQHQQANSFEPLQSEAGPSLPSLGVSPTQEGIILFGGNDLDDWRDTLDLFTPATKQWIVAGSMETKLGSGSAAALSGRVFLVGGGLGANWDRECKCLDLYSGKWYEMSQMSEIRGNFATVALDGKIYALGGGESGIQSPRVEMLDPELNQWMAAKQMNARRFGIAAAVMHGTIIAAGGFDGNSYLTSAERYDPRIGQWDLLPVMATRRGGHQAVVMDSELHILGGWDSKDFLDGHEIYDERANAWRLAPPMKTCRAYFGAACLDNELYALAGMQQKSQANELVERLDPQQNKWKAFMLEVEPGEADGGRKRAFSAPCKIVL